MTYKEWMALSEAEKDILFKKSVEIMDKESRKIERSIYFIKEGLKELKEKVEDYKIWKQLYNKSMKN